MQNKRLKITKTKKTPLQGELTPSTSISITINFFFNHCGIHEEKLGTTTIKNKINVNLKTVVKFKNETSSV